jgi:Lrp/AsnC family transcriptional regulator of ectoine degradation
MNAKRPPALDQIDIKILAALQRDGRSTVEKLARLVKLSSRACLERVRRLEAAGIITGYRALVELGLAAIEEVVECWEVSGTVDYIARFVCADLAAYQALTTQLIDDSSLGIARIVSHVALRAVRPFGGYPESLLARKPV